MTTDLNVEVLLDLCETSIKSLSRWLPTLHSLNALTRLEGKADVIDAFSIVASFSTMLLHTNPPSATDESLQTRLERLERRTDVLEGGRLEGASGDHHGGLTTFTHAHVSAQRSAFEDGRDDDGPGAGLTSSQSILRRPNPHPRLAQVLHPVRHIDIARPAPDEEPLYSFLVHFPIFTALGAQLSVVERKELFSGVNSVMAKWGFADGLTTRAYPRLRLTNEGAALIVVDEDLGRLEDIRKEFQAMQRTSWDRSEAEKLDRKFFLVGTWSEEHVVLLFSVSSNFGSSVAERSDAAAFRSLASPNLLWDVILAMHPVLSQYQELAIGKEGDDSPLGARLFHRTRQLNSSTEGHLLMLLVPFLGCPRAGMFAHDFVARHPTVVVRTGKTWTFNVRVVKLGPPNQKEDYIWDGPVLVADMWLESVHREFDPKYLK